MTIDYLYGCCRAGLDTLKTVIPAGLRTDHRPAKEFLRQHRRFRRKPECPAAKFHSREHCFQHSFTLQVMSAIGEIKTLIAEWKIRDRLIAHGDRQTDPVAE